MITVLSYIIAVILTVLIAIILFPIAGIFWILGLFGKIASLLFDATKKLISRLWRDLKNSSHGSESKNDNAPPSDGWVCSCGCKNTGKFCSECGKAMSTDESSKTENEAESEK